MDDLFLRACRREPVERVPVWIMRQAGRYLAEYRAVRERVDFVTLCKTPDLAAEVTLQPIVRLGVDAAILFSDLLTPAEPMGFRLKFDPGPVLDPPVRSAADVDRIRVPEPETDLAFVHEAIRILRRELRVPLIGFVGAPFTLAAYLVEGAGSKNFDRIRRLLYEDPATAHRLMEKAAATLLAHAKAQVRAGAQAIQLFDSWAGVLPPAAYREFGLRWARHVTDGLAGSGVPRIYFALNSAHLLDEIRDVGADVVGIDWRIGLDEATRRLGDRFVLQGNLDPCALLASPAVIDTHARRILREGASAPGHVFNLGHGILPNTPVEHARALVDAVRAASSR